MRDVVVAVSEMVLWRHVLCNAAEARSTGQVIPPLQSIQAYHLKNIDFSIPSNVVSFCRERYIYIQRWDSSNITFCFLIEDKNSKKKIERKENRNVDSMK